MTNEFKTLIKNELYRAFSHFGEIDRDILNEKVETELDTLMCFMASSDPDVIKTDKGEFTGYLVDIAVTNGLVDNEMIVLQMIVSDSSINYIINSYTVVKHENYASDNDFKIENERNCLVNLEDVELSMFV